MQAVRPAVPHHISPSPTPPTSLTAANLPLLSLLRDATARRYREQEQDQEGKRCASDDCSFSPL